MNILQCGKNYCATNRNKYYGIINRISFSFGVVHRRKELHERFFYIPKYKIALPFLEMKDLGIGA
jgi:hypothetical protein